MLNQSVLFIALRYIKGSKKQRFATFVATLATLGIAIGVCALVVVSSIMQGLQERLKENILSDCPHVVVKAKASDIPFLLNIKHVNALVPFVEGQAMIQYGSNISMVTLQANQTDSLYVSHRYANTIGLTTHRSSQTNKDDNILDLQYCIKMPHVDKAGYSYGSQFNLTKGRYELALNYTNFMSFNMDGTNSDNKVRLISTQNARYTPFGLTPIQRNFKVVDVIESIDKSNAPIVVGEYDDVRKFFRISHEDTYFRLFLCDPFAVDEVAEILAPKFEFTDWRSRYGDFFKAVGLEKVSMTIMLCLIVLVAAFNILSSLTMVVSSRVSEIAILKTLGMNNISLLNVFLLVGMSASFIGSLIGLLLGVPLAFNAQAILNVLGISIMQGELPVIIDFDNILAIVVMCWLVALLCTLYPAYYASKSDPTKHLASS